MYISVLFNLPTYSSYIYRETALDSGRLNILALVHNMVIHNHNHNCPWREGVTRARYLHHLYERLEAMAHGDGLAAGA